MLAIWNRRENGAVGLSDDFDAIHRGRRDLRRKLVRQGLLRKHEFVFASTVGAVNRMRRELLRGLRRYRSRRRPRP